MKQPPELDAAQRQMKPGAITLEGFLGPDRRCLAEIIEEDDNAVHGLGLTHEQIAERLEYFMRQALKGLGTAVTVDGAYEVRAETVRGVLPCPWPRDGVHPKSNAFLLNLRTGETLAWTGLTIHLIRAHGFYQGKGSRFRLDPERAKRVLGL